MILTGSARSIMVKLAYQSGFQAPLTITLLYLFGQSLSVFVYRIQQKWLSNDYNALESSIIVTDDQLKQTTHETSIELSSNCSNDVELAQQRETKEQSSCEEASGDPAEENFLPNSKADTVGTDQLSSSQDSTTTSSSIPASILSEMYKSIHTSISLLKNNDEMPNGSNHGLTPQSAERIRWAHDIPYYVRPAIPALFNLLNSALRWASLLYIDASVAEMLISGLELTLSVVAARVIRKRMVSRSRWVGVVIVAVGVVVIERANNWKHQQQEEEQPDDGVETSSINEDDNSNSNVTRSSAQNVTIGVILIILQSILSVLQDIGEEIFMQATTFPAMMMLGMEGLYGFVIGLIIYATIGNKFGIEDIDDTISMLMNNATLRWWLLGLPFLFLLTGIFNIKATEVTSAMTRNVWKNLRTVLVWSIALCIFYLGNNSKYGEAWHNPDSFFILLGFSVMTSGIVVYYWYKSQEQ